MTVMCFKSEIEYENKYSNAYLTFAWEKSKYPNWSFADKRKYCKEAYKLIKSTINNLNAFKLSLEENINDYEIEKSHTLCISNDDFAIDITAPLAIFMSDNFNSLSPQKQHQIAMHILKTHFNNIKFLYYLNIQ